MEKPLETVTLVSSTESESATLAPLETIFSHTRVQVRTPPPPKPVVPSGSVPLPPPPPPLVESPTEVLLLHPGTLVAIRS